MTTGEHPQLPQLIAALSDGSIEADETRRLNEQLLADPIALEAYLDHMELDAMLEREFSGEVNEAIPLTRSVSERNKVNGRSSSTRGVTWAAVTLVLLVTVGVFLNNWFQQPDNTSATTSRPLAMQYEGAVQIHSAAGALLPITIGQPIPVDASITTGEGAEIRLRHDDGTEITMLASSSLRLDASNRQGKHLALDSGSLRAEVARQPAGQPFVITTPHADVRVLGTRFELAADKEAGTRLNLESGRVELVRESEQPVVVEPNSIAVVRSADEPIRITPRPTIITAPDREAQFPGVYAIDFSSDGRTVIATTRRGAVYWQSNDEIETVRAIDQDDVKVVTQAGSLVVLEEKEPRRLVFWDAATRDIVRVVDQFNQLPEAFDLVAKGADKKSKTPFPSVRINALSPRGDWIAVHSRVKGKDSMHLFDLAKGESRIIERKCLMIDFRASPDGSLLAIGQSRGGLKNSGTIELISADNGEQVMLLTILEAAENQRPGIVQSLFEFSPDGQHLAVAIRGRLRVWDLTTGDRVANIEDAGNVRHVAISAGAEWVAGVRPKYPIQLWNVADPHKSFLLEPAGSTQAVRFSPDGDELAAQLNGGQLRVWEFGSQSKSTDVGKP